MDNCPEKARGTLISGVFSPVRGDGTPAGHASAGEGRCLFIFAEENEDGSVSCQSLNENNVPSGSARNMSRDEFLESYVPEPQMFINVVGPAIRRLQRTVAKAERMRVQNKLFSAEIEYKSALRIDEENIRATFGLGLTYLDRGDTDKADLVFRRIVRLEGAFGPEHKHLFNEFGIKMRKGGMFRQATKYYARAFKLSRDDENLLYNFARALYEKGSAGQACSFLKKALALNPAFEEARIFHDRLAEGRNGNGR